MIRSCFSADSRFRLRWVRFALASVLLLAPFAVGVAASANDAPAGRSYVYKQSAGIPQELEIYFPPGHNPAKARVPGLLLFHGGGWSGGNLNQFRAAGHYFASRGLVAATANYRMLTTDEGKDLPPGATRKRVCITDAKSAIRWMKQHASELGVDPRRIITGGGSAGGHVAVLATTTSELDDPADPKGIDPSVVAYLLFNPAFLKDDRNDPQVDVLPHLASGFAPAIVFFGTNDKTWKPGWDAAYARLKALGNTTTQLWLAEGEGHGFFNRPPWTTLTLVAADRFLVERGLLAGEPTFVTPTGSPKLVRAD